ncbi:MAG TPA: ribosome small subunit-dependent GTPase A [Rectinemataceae bacterium]
MHRLNKETASGLETWGWDEEWEALARNRGGAAYLGGEIFPARVTEIQRSGPIAVSSGLWPRGRRTESGTPGSCATAKGSETICEGRLLQMGIFAEGASLPGDLPAVGDWVLAQAPNPGSGSGGEDAWIPIAILPRRSFLARKAPGSRHGGARSIQAIAANVDLVAVMTACGPDFSPARVERMLALVHASGAQALVLLTKTDLVEDPGALISELATVSGQVPVLGLSAASGRGFEALEPWLSPGKTLALMGSSGVGKSTLLNALAGFDLAKTNAIRAQDGKGLHTTTHRELYLLDSGIIILDNPGIREVQLWVDESDLDAIFPEIASLAVFCRFRDCGHTEEPGCAVLAALDSGKLERSRYERWLGLLREAALLDRRAEKSQAATERAKWKSISKASKAFRRDRESRGMI